MLVILQHFFTQDQTVASATYDETAAVFFWKGERLEEYWYWILNALMWVVDLTRLLIMEVKWLLGDGKKAEDLFLNDGTIP